MPSEEYVKRVIMTLNSNPTASDLDYLVEAYSNIGYLLSEAEGLAEAATNVRRHNEADAYLAIKSSGDKITDKQAEAAAMVRSKDDRQAEVAAFTKARKLKNLRDAIEQAINAIKYLGRQAG